MLASAGLEAARRTIFHDEKTQATIIAIEHDRQKAAALAAENGDPGKSRTLSRAQILALVLGEQERQTAAGEHSEERVEEWDAQARVHHEGQVRQGNHKYVETQRERRRTVQLEQPAPTQYGQNEHQPVTDNTRSAKQALRRREGCGIQELVGTEEKPA